MQCKCVKCGERYTADGNVQAELTRFYFSHRRKVPAEAPWLCDLCWETFKPNFDKSRDSSQPQQHLAAQVAL